MESKNMSNIPNDLSEQEKASTYVKGTLMNIKHPRVFEGMLNVIEEYKEDELSIRLTDPFLKGSVLVGDKVKCQILTDKYEHTIYGEVSHIDIISPGYVKIKVIRAFKYENIRRDKRYLVNFRANMFSHDCDKPIYGIIKNISLSGMAVVSNHHLEKLTNLRIKFSLNNEEDRFIELNVKVIRDSSNVGYFEYGMMISRVDEKSNEALSSLIDGLENDEKSILGI